MANSQQDPFTDILKQIYFEDPQEIAKKETGQKIAKQIYAMQFGVNGSGGFFTKRAEKYKILEDWSLGKQDMAQFLPMMNIADANKAEANIDLTPIMIGAQFVGTKIESIAKNNEYPCVDAIDDESLEDKDNRYWEAMHRMKEVGTIDEIQQLTGMQVEPTNAYVPNDEISAKVYFEIEDRLPKEIKFETFLKDTLISNDYDRVLKPKMLRDNIVFNMECLKIEKASSRDYRLRKCIPKNVFYNFFLSDTGRDEISHIGEGYNLKVKDIRGKWGVSANNPKGLTEKEIYDFARLSSQNNPASPLNFSHSFSEQYTDYNKTTPWDDFSAYVIDFEIQVIESDYYVSKIDNYGKENISPKIGIPKPTSSNAKTIKKEKKRWYRCVYAPYSDMVLYWGKPDLGLREHSTYTINIANNNGEYVPSLFERALEPLKEYALCKLKRKLLLSKLSPAAYKVDVEAARNILDGSGNSLKWEEIVRIKDATGVELWSSKGLDPLTAGNPTFAAATSDPTLSNIIQLSELLNNISAEIRVLLGVPIYLDGSDVGERTAARLAEGQSAGSFNVTGFVPNGHNQLMEEVLYKVCLLNWQDIVTDKKESADDLINTKFKVSVKMKMSDYDREVLKQRIDKWSSTLDGNGKPILSPKDAFTIEQIDNYRLASLYLANVIKENEIKEQEKIAQNQEYTAKIQQQSNEQAAENAKQLQDDKLRIDKEKMEFEALQNIKVEVVRGSFAIASKSENPEMPAWLQGIVQQLIPNISIPIAAENKQMQEAVIAKGEQEQAEMQQQEQGQPQEEEVTAQEQPMY